MPDAYTVTHQAALTDKEANEIIALARAQVGNPDPPLGEKIGFGGFKQFSGILAEEYQPKLHGVKKVEVFLEMRADPAIEALLLILKAPLLDATWTVEAGGTQARARKAADLVERQLGIGRPLGVDDSFQAVTLWKLLSMFDFGFQLVTENWRDDGKEIVLDDLIDLHPRTILQGARHWEFDDRGKTVGAWQTIYNPSSSGGQFGGYVTTFIPIERMTHAICGQQFGSPEGRALCRSSYMPWYLRATIYKANAIGHVRAAMGCPHGTYPADSDPEDRTKFEDALRNILVSERAYILTPEGYLLENFKLEHDAENSLATIEHLGTMINLSVAGQFFNLGQTRRAGTGAGNDAAGDFVDMFTRVCSHYGNYIGGLITRGIARKIILYNYPDLKPELYPRVKATITRMSVFGYADALRKLLGNQAALVWTEDDQKDLREKMNMPRLPDGVDPTPPPIKPAPGANPDGSQPNNPASGEDASLPGANK